MHPLHNAENEAHHYGKRALTLGCGEDEEISEEQLHLVSRR